MTAKKKQSAPVVKKTWFVIDDNDELIATCGTKEEAQGEVEDFIREKIEEGDINDGDDDCNCSVFEAVEHDVSFEVEKTVEAMIHN